MASEAGCALPDKELHEGGKNRKWLLQSDQNHLSSSLSLEAPGHDLSQFLGDDPTCSIQGTNEGHPLDV